MGVRLIVLPRVTITREEFLADKYLPYSIAVDGIVPGGPLTELEQRKVIVEHHDGCDRIATRSSCAQVYMLVNMGLFDAFTYQGRPRADVYVNDGDQDVILATYGLLHHQQVEDSRFKFRFKEMVQLEDVLDMSVGLYPIKRPKRLRLLRRLHWVMEPYSEARADGSLHTMGADAMHAMILQAHRRVRDTLYGRGKEIDLDDRFEVIADFGRWQFIKEIGRHARIGIAQKGLKAFISHVARCSGKEGDRYVIIRRSQFIDWFPIGLMCDMLNAEEGTAPQSRNCWGGSRDNVIGSPREHGSKLRPERVLEIVKEACERQARFLAGGSKPKP